MEESVKDQLYDEEFREQLVKGMTFPGEYPFKFIVKSGTDARERLEAVFAGSGARISSSASSKGNYVSLTVVMPVENPDQILDKYHAVAGIPEVIKL